MGKRHTLVLSESRERFLNRLLSRRLPMTTRLRPIRPQTGRRRVPRRQTSSG